MYMAIQYLLEIYARDGTTLPGIESFFFKNKDLPPFLFLIYLILSTTLKTAFLFYSPIVIYLMLPNVASIFILNTFVINKRPVQEAS